MLPKLAVRQVSDAQLGHAHEGGPVQLLCNFGSALVRL